MEPTPGQKAGASALVLTAAGLIIAGLISVLRTDDHHVKIQPDPAHGLIAGSTCLWTTASADPSALAFFGLQADAGPRNVVARICAPEADAGEGGESYALPPGMFPLSDTQRVEAYDGGPVLEAWDQDAPDAPFECACSTGSACSIALEDGGSEAAPTGVTLRAPLTWSGSGCRPKPCVEWGAPAPSSWPSACPVSP